MDIFGFGLGIDSPESSPEILGGKGAGLVWMDKQGIRVPPGFVIPTTVCVEYMADPSVTMKKVAAAIEPWVARLEKKFGFMPLVSVRSGARQSMPGMMDTILNVGLDEKTAPAWIERIGKECVADSRRRLIEMFGSVVCGIDRAKFEGKDASGARDLYCAETKEKQFPGAQEQMLRAIEAVFKSWNNERAKVYRKMNGIPETWGTAVTVQAMVFGNMNDQSGTGVLFTRNPDSGENKVVGEFMVNAQGEDVVAGIRTPMKLSEMPKWNAAVSEQLLATVAKLEQAKKDVQDVEFTIQNGELYVLQTRNAKRSSRAAVRIALEMLDEGMLNEADVFTRVSYKDFLRAQMPALDPKFKEPAKFTGIPACSGIVTGKVVLTAEDAVNAKEAVILVTQETTPDDIAGMAAARGVLTMTGGATSHAAVVARGMNKPCVVGLSESLTNFAEGQEISIDGATGRVWMTPVPVVAGSDEYVERLTKMMKKAASVRLVGDEVVVLADYYGNIDGAIKVVAAALNGSDKVVVDVRPPSGESWNTFYAMFGEPDEKEMLWAIHKEFGKKVQILSNIKMKNVQLIATASTPEEIVMAEGDFFLACPSAPWVEKLVAMKEKIEKSRPVFVGQVKAGGLVSKAQLAMALLK